MVFFYKLKKEIKIERLIFYIYIYIIISTIFALYIFFNKYLLFKHPVRRPIKYYKVKLNLLYNKYSQIWAHCTAHRTKHIYIYI